MAEKIYWSGFDYLKYILSVLVIIIHTEPFDNWIHPLLSIAVPMFFVLSSYFFFNRLNKEESDTPKLYKFIKRNSLLYLFWFVILIPITLEMRHYFDNGFVIGIMKIIKGVFFGSTFKASWFLSAIVIGVTIFYYLRKITNRFVLAIILVAIYSLCCVSSCYWYLFSNETLIKYEGIYRSVFGEVHHSFLIALFWTALGWIFANKKFSDGLGVGKLFALLILSFILLNIEHGFIVEKFGLARSYTCYICLPFVVFFFMSLVIKLRNTDIYIPYLMGKDLRKMSTINYCSHASLAYFFLEYGFVSNHIILFFATWIVCSVISVFIFKVESKKGFGWLKYSH